VSLLIDEAVRERVRQIEIPWSACGVDPYGISEELLARQYSMLGFLYKRYFSVETFGLEHVPRRGRAMLVGNHSGGVALDGAMVTASMFFDLEPPRLVQGMAEKFLNRVPFASQWLNRVGHFTGLPETAQKLLEDERLLMVFPEGAKGTAKLYHQRYSLVNFGTGFMRIALAAKAPIVPFAFIGGGEAIPTIANLYRVGRLFGVPYVPVTPYGLAIPLPVSLQIIYGKPIVLEGSPHDTDDVIARHVERVRSRIANLMKQGRELRERKRKVGELELG
jgi:1-acyl-sn-glycerol-3-phosphate acyltransferase